MPNQDVTASKIVVLAGGWSDEREVSKVSGSEVAKALEEAGFNRVDLLDPASDDFLSRLVSGDYDVAFIAMHGRMGEDGSVQGLLDVVGIPYTFSHVFASSLAMAKDMAKLVFHKAGIPVPRGVQLTDAHPDEGELDKLVEELGLPLFVKPVGNGSSFGISRVTTREELAPAIVMAASNGDRVLVEEAIEGTEITVPVVGNDDAEALPIIEVVTGADFYDVKVKYEPSDLHHVIPARLSSATYALAQEYAIRAHRALGCVGCSRSDFIVRADGVPVILETNTIPGMTPASLLPDAARHAGIEFPELCKRFVELALECESPS